MHDLVQILSLSNPTCLPLPTHTNTTILIYLSTILSILYASGGVQMQEQIWLRYSAEILQKFRLQLHKKWTELDKAKGFVHSIPSFLQINTRNNRGKKLLCYIDFFIEIWITNTFLQSCLQIRLLQVVKDQMPHTSGRHSLLQFFAVYIQKSDFHYWKHPYATFSTFKNLCHFSYLQVTKEYTNTFPTFFLRSIKYSFISSLISPILLPGFCLSCHCLIQSYLLSKFSGSWKLREEKAA